MAMSKQDFIALADAIRDHNRVERNVESGHAFTTTQLEMLATFCKRQNSAFMRDRWLNYIAGDCGPNGGTVKK